MRRHLSYANVAATLALVFAMSGGALAAKHYLINSTKQISPKVLRKLHGARGASGPIGAVGPQGVTGAQGTRGLRGPQGEPGFSALSRLPSGSSESGDFAASQPAAEAGQSLSTAVTFAVPLTAAIPAEKVELTSVSTPGEHCLGPSLAAKGWLCVYVSSETNVEGTAGTSFDPEAFATVGSGRYGVGFNWTSQGEGLARVAGTYTVTAP